MERAIHLCVIGLVLGTTACAPSRGDKIREAERTVRSEQTADKLLERGRLFARVGDYTRASQYLTAALDAGANPDQVLPLLMRVFIVSGRYRTALQLGEEELTDRKSVV